jgi:primary-amine oxidase
MKIALSTLAMATLLLATATAQVRRIQSFSTMVPQPGFPQHPLDPLTPDELGVAVNILKAAHRISDTSRFPTLQLQEPDKASVLRWRPGDSLHREAFAVIFDKGHTFESVVDLTQRRVESFREVVGVQPSILTEEQLDTAQTVPLSDPTFVAALRLRGITNLNALICAPLSAGYFAVPEEEGKRLLRVTCFDASTVKNIFSRPIENLHAVVDVNAKKVLRVVDGGVTPVPNSTVNGEYPPAQTRPALKPLVVTQPQGASFQVSGHQVTWDNWKFHFRVEQREGLVLSTTTYNSARSRSVLYKASISETFVPYSDPSSNWYYRTFMDEGEYGLGKSARPLDTQRDCPANASFFDVTVADDFGSPFTIPQAVCIFEQTPQLLWTHFDIFTGSLETRAGRELVLRYAAVVGNYDYFFDWIFKQDGSLELRLGAGGIMEMKAVQSATAAGNRNAESQFGNFADTNLVAQFHQHIFNVRLDLDVDGTSNSFIEATPTVVRTANSLRKSAWILQPQTFDNELEARRPFGDSHARWMVTNPQTLNRLGQAVAYEVKVDGEGELLMSPDDYPALRAGFTQYALWVTPLDPTQMYAAGSYPNQSKGGDGLPSWTQSDRDISNRDIVLWVNVGLTHVARPEEWPVMPTEWFGRIELQPFGFFDHNPSIDVPQ